MEAVLFTMGRSVEIRQLAAALETGEPEAEAAAERLKARYEESVCGMQVLRLENSYQMCTRTGYYENLIRVAAAPKKQVLSDVVLETLAIIAYKQPVTKADIEKIRGVKSDHAVNRLIEYNLVYEAGRLDAPGKPALFATTEEFLRRFGVSSTEPWSGSIPWWPRATGIRGTISRISCRCWTRCTKRASPSCTSETRKTAIRTVPWYPPRGA